MALPLFVFVVFFSSLLLDGVASKCHDDSYGQGDPLFLTPYVQNGRASEAYELSKIHYRDDYLGHGGYFSVHSESKKKTNNMYFWFQPSHHGPSRPLLLWLQGGPGGPSVFGAMGEMGNWYVNEDCELHKRCNSWCQDYNCLFVDQPVQAGYSFQVDSLTGKWDPSDIEYTTSSKECGYQLHELLKQFFQVFPDHLQSPFWVTGESYGGNYVANVAMVIAENNHDPKINLVGVSVGDPALHPVAQWPTYASTLYGFGLLSLQQKAIVEDAMMNGVKALQNGEGCRAGFDYWNMIWNDDGLAPEPFYFLSFTGSSNTAMVPLYSEPGTLDYYESWLGTNTTSRDLHYGGGPLSQPGMYNSYYPNIYTALVDSGDWCQNSTDLYASLFVKYGLHVNIYTGTADPILGPPTTEAGIQTLLETAALLAGDPSLYKQWINANSTFWGASEKEQFGKAREFTYNGARFSYPVVRNAGHEVPAYEPRAALDMVNRVFYHHPFDLKEHHSLPDCAPCGGSPPYAGC